MLFDKIKKEIANNPHWVNLLFPGSKQKGREIYFDSPSYNSWSYNVSKNIVKDFRTNETGSIIDAYQRFHNCNSTMQAAIEMGQRMGNVITPPQQKPNDKTKILEIIKRIWDASVPMGGTIAEKYLKNRRINLPFSSTTKGNTLRYHPALWHKETKHTHPTMIAGIYNEQRKLVGIHRHYLTEKGEKLKLQNNKMSLGNVKGNAVQLSKPGHNLVICEGVESGLTLMEKLNKPVWCALSAGNIPNLNIPASVKEIQIYPDIEPSNTGQQNAIKAQDAWAKKGLNVRIILPILKLTDGTTLNLNETNALANLESKKKLIPKNLICNSE